MLHSANEKNQCTRYFSYRAISTRFSQPTSELLQELKEMVKSHPRPTRWHCGWFYQHSRTQAKFSWAWQLQSRLCDSDFQHKSLCLEPHPAVLPIQQLFSTLSPSQLRLFQIIINIFFFPSQEAPRLHFSSSWIFRKTFQRFKEIFSKLVSLSVLSG